MYPANNQTGICSSKYDKKEQKCLKTAKEFDDTYFEIRDDCANLSKKRYALFVLDDQPVPNFICTLPKDQNPPKFVLWKHREQIAGYRQMTSYELTNYMYEIGKLYEINRGFSPCREKIGISHCNYCSIDNNIWYFNDHRIASGNFGDDKATCSDHLTGICTHSYDDKEQKCFKTVDEFEEIYLRPNEVCVSPSISTYALFIRLD